MADGLRVPDGLVVITTYGQIQGETAFALLELRSFSEKNGLVNVNYACVPGTLVEKARNDAVRQFLANPQGGWILMIDGDMTFPPDALLRLLNTAYAECPWADVVGAYCPLRGDLALPTIDTGTGTWESHYPQGGPLEVIRTGAAFLLVKRHVFERLKDPWFRMRVPAWPADFMAEIDNFARMKFDGRNPFRDLPGQFWEKLERCAQDDPSVAQFVAVEVGEDSGFCDRVRLAGMRIVVQTNVETGHIDRKVATWVDHKKAMEDRARQERLCVGVML